MTDFRKKPRICGVFELLESCYTDTAMKLLYRYLKQYKKTLFGALGLAAINQIFSLLDPQVFRLIIDNYATRATEIERGEFIRGVLFLLLLYVLFAFISRTAKAFQDYYVNVVTQKVGTQLYADSVSHSFALPYGMFEDQRSGELLQKLEKARTDNQDLVALAVNVLFFSLVGAIFVIIYAFFVHWSVGISYIALFPVLGSTVYFLSKSIKKKQKEIVAQQASLAGSTTETIRNVELVKSLGLQEQEIQRLNNVNDAILKLELQKVKLVRRLVFIQGTLINLIRSALMLLMLWLIYTGQMSLGEFFTLFVYSFYVFGPLYELGNLITKYQEAKAANEQLDAILSTEPEAIPENPQEVGHITNVELENVSFKYESNAADAVKNISLDIKPGQTIAFVGPSGSGKSTLVKLLVGLYTPQSGVLTYNNIKSTTIDYQLLRQRIGLVAQETQLFAGTIRENLKFVRPDATDEQCLEVLKAAEADTVLERTDKGLDAVIGEGGLKLSGGEKQRLAIARALLRNPELIIFDEATSSLDSLTEQAITETIQNIEKQNHDLITIQVAHRLSTILHADVIYVLEKGEIVEQGSHKELLDKKGLYAALWRQQSAAVTK